MMGDTEVGADLGLSDSARAEWQPPGMDVPANADAAYSSSSSSEEEEEADADGAPAEKKKKRKTKRKRRPRGDPPAPPKRSTSMEDLAKRGLSVETVQDKRFTNRDTNYTRPWTGEFFFFFHSPLFFLISWITHPL